MRVFESAPVRLFTVGIGAVLGITFAAPVFAANHLEAPLIAFPQDVQTSDIYVHQDVGGNELLTVIAHARASGEAPDSIVFTHFFGDADSRFFAENESTNNLTLLILKAELGLIPVRPQVALNGNGTGLAAVYKDFDRFAQPFAPPKSELRRLGFPPTPQHDQTIVTNAEIQRERFFDDELDLLFSIDTAADNGFFVSHLSASAPVSFFNVLEKYNADGTRDENFIVPLEAIAFDDLPFEPAAAIKGLANGGVARVRTTQQDVILENYDASGTKIGTSTNINASAIDNANVVVIDESPDGTLNIVHQQTDPNDFTPQAVLTRVAGQDVQRASLGIPGLINPINPDVAVNKNGETFVAYHAETSGPNVPFDRGDVYVQIFNLFGLAIGGPRRVNTNTVGTQRDASIDDTKDGGVVVAFTTNATDSGNQAIHSIKLDAPLATNKNTIVANDFGTPTTPLRNAGFSATSNGLPIIGNQVFIAADPVNPDSTNGVLGFDITDPSGGSLLATFNEGLVLDGFPNGERGSTIELSFEFSLLSTFSQVTPTRLTLNLTAHDAETSAQLFNLSARQRVDPGDDSSRVDEINATNPAPGVVAQWIDLNFTADLSAEQSALLAMENIVFSYGIGVEANGPALIYIDDLKVDLVPAAVPLPSPGVLLISACAVLFGRRKVAKLYS